MDPRTQEQLIYEAHRKSTGASYLLWFFLGFLGAHRFYLGRKGTGIVQLLMCLSIVGIIPLAFWWLIDAFMIPGMVRDENMKTINAMAPMAFKGGPEGEKPRLEQPPRTLDPRVEEIRAMRRR